MLKKLIFFIKSCVTALYHRSVVSFKSIISKLKIVKDITEIKFLELETKLTNLILKMLDDWEFCVKQIKKKVTQIIKFIDYLFKYIIRLLVSCVYFICSLLITFFKIFFDIFTFKLEKDKSYNIFLKNRFLKNYKSILKTTKIESKVPYREPLVNGNINKFIHVSSTFLSIKLLHYWRHKKSKIYKILIYLFKK